MSNEAYLWGAGPDDEEAVAGRPDPDVEVPGRLEVPGRPEEDDTGRGGDEKGSSPLSLNMMGGVSMADCVSRAMARLVQVACCRCWK